MISRIVEIAEDGRHLAVSRGFLTVRSDRAELGRIPFDDIAALIVNAHGTTYSNNLLLALSKRNAPVVLCGANHRPASPAPGHR